MRKIKSFSLTFFAILLGLIITTSLSIFLLYHSACLHSASGFFQHNQILFLGVQLILMSFFIFFWPSLIGFVGKQRRWPRDAIDYLSNEWWRLLLLWLAIEILVVFTQLL